MATEMRITKIDEATYRVESTSGNVYSITYAGCGDGDPEFVALWKCDCPAGRHGRSCKHLAQFLATKNTIEGVI